MGVKERLLEEIEGLDERRAELVLGFLKFVKGSSTEEAIEAWLEGMRAFLQSRGVSRADALEALKAVRERIYGASSEASHSD